MGNVAKAYEDSYSLAAYVDDPRVDVETLLIIAATLRLILDEMGSR